jgi:hypothetical protein
MLMLQLKLLFIEHGVKGRVDIGQQATVMHNQHASVALEHKGVDAQPVQQSQQGRLQQWW